MADRHDLNVDGDRTQGAAAPLDELVAISEDAGLYDLAADPDDCLRLAEMASDYRAGNVRDE